jgi:hypothetical protein
MPPSTKSIRHNWEDLEIKVLNLDSSMCAPVSRCRVIVLCISIDEAMRIVSSFEARCQVKYHCQMLGCERVRMIFTSPFMV